MLLQTIRKWQFTRMELSLQTVASIAANVPVEALTTYRDGGNGWTVTAVVAHLRDFERLFLERAQLTIDQEAPALPYPDPDELAAQNDYYGLAFKPTFEEWSAARAEFLAFMRARTEDDWERSAQHPTRGPFTLHDQLFLASLHDSLHLEQITRVLAEKLA